MRISCVQMDMRFGEPDYNYAHAEALVRKAVQAERPDAVLLPETWNTGFAPTELDRSLADPAGERTKRVFSALAKELSVNIVAGSVVTAQPEGLRNTSFVFDRGGSLIASYDKTHLFSPMGENKCYAVGNKFTTFLLDGVRCGVIICYDLRFPELIRSLALSGMDVLFMASQWPLVRAEHLSVLLRARAIENQCYAVLCNSCGKALNTQYGGGSAVIDPLGNVQKRAGQGEEILTDDVDIHALTAVRRAIPVFTDRRPELYQL